MASQQPEVCKVTVFLNWLRLVSPATRASDFRDQRVTVAFELLQQCWLTAVLELAGALLSTCTPCKYIVKYTSGLPSQCCLCRIWCAAGLTDMCLLIDKLSSRLHGC